ncbi:F-box protein CPR1-like [Papaver somniferum]|uniref:F-box protein CPR1-like n=1 Tax=Papaver somniferum TaxID=3469 RepID=UPI000E705DA3|nr:F-box protein CPR1-like [Papaver somniferum]
MIPKCLPFQEHSELKLPGNIVLTLGNDNDRYDTSSSEVWVCRLGSESWESIGNIPYDTNYSTAICEKPLNGRIIHWTKETEVIVSFDIVEVRTKEIHIPDSCYLDDELNWLDMEVGVLGEDLYLSVNDRSNSKIDPWLIKDYGVKDSWTKIFSISKDETNIYSLVPMHYVNKNREILLYGYGRLEGELSKDVLVSYDLKYGRPKILDIPCMPKYLSATTCVGSLISLNSGKFAKAEKRPMGDTKRKRGATL